MISVSFLKSKLPREETIQKIDDSIADCIHVDLMDGIYVANKNWELNDDLAFLANVQKPLDFHLMIKEPLAYIKKLVALKNIWAITFHLNSTKNPEEIIHFLKNYNLKIGIAINPDEDITILDKYLSEIDYVLIMGVYPGEGGQKFIPSVLKKIPYLSQKNVLIGLDGGINAESMKYFQNYPIDNIVSGSFVCESDDYNKQINLLRNSLVCFGNKT